MFRTIFAAFALATILSASAHAATGSLTAAQQEQLKPAAEKSCNDALDHDRFDYGTMEECVDSTMQKMARAQPQGAQALAGRSPHAN